MRRRHRFRGHFRGRGIRRPPGLGDAKTLAEMAQGESAKVAYLHGRGPVVHRLRQFGILPGAEITVVRYAPLRDPIEINVYGALVSLRIQEAFHVVMSDGRED